MTRRKKVEKEEPITDDSVVKEVMSQLVDNGSFIQGCFPVGYVFPEDEEIE
jgi:hypothetical protein